MPGQQYDVESGLFYNWNRYYDPTTGRYVEFDPIGLTAGSLSPYDYVNGNPAAGEDPSGLFKIYGNWCGPNWTGGRVQTYSPAGKDYYAPAIDATDAACRRHDITYYACRNAFPCDKTKRAQCMTTADRGLANEVRFNTEPAAMAIYIWMNNNNMPDPGDNAGTCCPAN